MGFNKKGYFNLYYKDSVGVTHSMRYKIINNSIIPQVPANENNISAQFKISELTTNTLKLTLHITYTMKEVIKDEDLIILVFEEESK